MDLLSRWSKCDTCVGHRPWWMILKPLTRESFSWRIHAALIYQSLTQSPQTQGPRFGPEEKNAEATELHKKILHLNKLLSEPASHSVNDYLMEVWNTQLTSLKWFTSPCCCCRAEDGLLCFSLSRGNLIHRIKQALRPQCPLLLRKSTYSHPVHGQESVQSPRNAKKNKRWEDFWIGLFPRWSLFSLQASEVLKTGWMKTLLKMIPERREKVPFLCWESYAELLHMRWWVMAGDPGGWRVCQARRQMSVLTCVFAHAATCLGSGRNGEDNVITVFWKRRQATINCW